MIQQIAVQPTQTYTNNQRAAVQKTQSKDTFKSLMKSAAKASDKKAGAAKGSSSETVKTKKEDTKEQDSAVGEKNRTAVEQNPDLAQAGSAVTASVSTAPTQDTTAAGEKADSAILLETGQSTQAVSASNLAAQAIQVSGKSVSQETGADTQLTAQQTAAQATPGQTAVKSVETAQTVTQPQTEQVKNTENFQVEMPQAGQAKASETQTTSDLDTAQVIAKETQAAQTVPNETKADGTQSQKAGNINLQQTAQSKGDSSTAKAEVKTDSQPAAQMKVVSESAESASGEKSLQSASGQTKSLSEKSNRSSTGTAVQNVTNLYSDGNVVVKVSDAPAKAETSASRQVADTVSYQLKNGKQEFQMDLYPQSLGKVAVKLTTENGILTVEIAASDPKTQSLLIANSGDIKSLLQTSTGQTVQVVKQEQAQWYNQQQDGGYGGQQEQQGQQQDSSGDQNRQAILYDSKDSNLNTGDFLSMMRQLNIST